MAKFSVGGEEDGEDGSSTSSPRAKRKRTSFRINAVVNFPRHNRQREEGEEQGFDYCKEETASDEEQRKRHRIDEIEEQVGEDGTEKALCSVKSCSKNVKENGSISMFLIDPEVLDCSICCEPLSVPIFQCENGHIACSSCCNKLKNRCATCSWPIGYNRCRAVEKVLESIRLPCKQSKYGCKEIVSYGSESDHDKKCLHAPCKCPLSDCNFVASSKQLSLHFSSKHTDSAISFQFSSSFTICLNANDNYCVLQEQGDGILFILSNSFDHLGNAVKVCCIRPPSLKEAFSYDLRVETQDLSLVLQSSMKNIRSSSDCYPSTRFLLIPRDLFSSSSKIKLNICIWQNTGGAP
ncbi:E3 ubiquitin-protein ligase SINA-like 10 [Cucurbita maxima]|uniref:RING-type E3 ubiquitin transferase n=1 Tax=Cucurbita maxima TaxID=3661 RepID=A0A6J1JTG5_CUCMA|nr:E3 ubiquitin-protein ligase SINA-like 10 [Cucurbita maxima]